MAHWHALAKLRLHTDETLDSFDQVTCTLGEKLRKFVAKTCAAYQTEELPKEKSARMRRQKARTTGTGHQHQGEHISASLGNTSGEQPLPEGEAITMAAHKPQIKKDKVFNLNTYKTHALGDYATTIRQNGTTDSYSTEPVSDFTYRLLKSHIEHLLYPVPRENWSIDHQRQGTKGPARRNMSNKLLGSRDVKHAFVGFAINLILTQWCPREIRMLQVLLQHTIISVNLRMNLIILGHFCVSMPMILQ